MMQLDGVLNLQTLMSSSDTTDVGLIQADKKQQLLLRLNLDEIENWILHNYELLQAETT